MTKKSPKKAEVVTIFELSKKQTVTVDEMFHLLYDWAKSAARISDVDAKSFIETLARVKIEMHTDYELLRESAISGIENVIETGSLEDTHGYLSILKAVNEKYRTDRKSGK
jgi:hypothetical protein